MTRLFYLAAIIATAVSGTVLDPRATVDALSKCPGYKASNVRTGRSTLTADLKLAGKACNVYGDDLKNLRLEVTYETGK